MLPVLRVVQFFSLFSMAGTQKSSPMASNGYLNTNGLSSFNNVLNGLGGVNTNNNPNTNRNMNSNMASKFNTNNNDNFNNFLSRYNNNVNRNLNMNNAVLSRNPALLTSRNYNNNLGSTFPAVNNNNVNTNNNNIGLSTAPQSSFNNNVPGISAVPQASLGLTAAPQSGYNPFSDFTASLAQRKEGSLQVQVEVPPLANVQPQFSPLKATLFFDCQVTGDPPVKVTWLKEGLPLDVANQARYVVLADQGTGSNRLLVTGATEAGVGRYDCQASNTFGTHLDTAYVYKDEKAVTCDDTFSICSLTICGGHCPGDCQNSADPVFGTDTYTENSSICRSSIHAGVLGVTESGTVVWMNTAHTAPFTASLHHGVTSMQVERRT